jgi:hypothetical protein
VAAKRFKRIENAPFPTLSYTPSCGVSKTILSTYDGTIPRKGSAKLLGANSTWSKDFTSKPAPKGFVPHGQDIASGPVGRWRSSSVVSRFA